MKSRPYRPRETNEAELSESDKQEYTAEARSDNSPLFFAVLLRKNPPKWWSLTCQDWVLDRKSGTGMYSIFVFVWAAVQSFPKVQADIVWQNYSGCNTGKWSVQSKIFHSSVRYFLSPAGHGKTHRLEFLLITKTKLKDFWVDFSFKTPLETSAKQICCSKTSSEGLGSTVEISIYLSTIWQFL